MAETSRARGCFKYGCFGCLGVLALGIVVTVFFAVVTAIQDDTVLMEDRAFDQEIPRAPGVPVAVEDDIGDPMSDIVQGFRLGGYEVDEPGRVILDLSIGEFEIVPGPADQPAHVEATYDTNRYELRQDYETWGENGWTYKVRFGAKNVFRMMGDHKRPPKVRIVLPRDRPFVIEADISMGESRTELGGLWVLDAAFDLGMGEHTVSFAEPLAAPMHALVVDGSMGEVRIRGAGNASPERIEARHSMGALNVDLRGAWIRDGRIEVRGSMGELVVRVPDDVRLDLERASVGLGDANTHALRNRPEPPEGAPTLTLSARGSMGELRIVD